MDAAGLSGAEVLERRARDGPNEISLARRRPVWQALVGQLVHFFALMLWAAAALAFVAGLPELGVAIAAVVVVNAAFAFAQEYRAERAAERLRALLPQRVTVIRNGERSEIDATDVVVGDLVILEAGDRIPADLRALEVHALMLDTSALTGESVTHPAGSDELLYAGTFVTEGEAIAVAVATGMGTRLADIATMTRSIERPRAPLTLELHRVVRTIAAIAVSVGALFFVTSVMLGTPPSEGFVFAIGVTVALVPEGLLPTVTLSLAIGAQRMAARNALVRRLEAVETLGSTTFICTDKTGTLTLNEMSVVEVWMPTGDALVHGSGYSPEGTVEENGSSDGSLRALALAAARCSSGRAVVRDGHWVAVGDPMEAALDVFARRAGIDVDADRVAHPVTSRYPFDARRRRMSLVVDGRLFVKGASDSVLSRCRDRAGAEAAVERMTARGLRVLAVAQRKAADGDNLSADAAERDLDLLGIVGLEDPPRPEARASIAACRTSGIKVAMVTGDHPSTAAAIARETGLMLEPELVLVGAELPAEDDELGELLDHDGIVLARVAPEEKLRIARALRARGHVLAMTGDGVNDGPALQEADIGIAMGRTGTDVAREAADLVLLDDDFATIVAAVTHGRAIFSNVRRFLTYHLTDNVAELTPFVVWAMSGGRFPLALGILQILALDLGTDTFSAVALGAEPPSPSASHPRPARGRLLNKQVATRAFGIVGPLEGALGIGAFLVSLLASGWRPGAPFPTGPDLMVASGATFSVVVMAQTANAFACRSTTVWPGKLGWFSNRLLVGAAAIELVITAGFLWIDPIASALGHAPPSTAGWMVAFLSAPAVLAADALYKAVGRRHPRPTGQVERPPNATPRAPTRSLRYSAR